MDILNFGPCCLSPAGADSSPRLSEVDGTPPVQRGFKQAPQLLAHQIAQRAVLSSIHGVGSFISQSGDDDARLVQAPRARTSPKSRSNVTTTLESARALNQLGVDSTRQPQRPDVDSFVAELFGKSTAFGEIPGLAEADQPERRCFHVHSPARTPILGVVAMHQPATLQTAGAMLHEMHLTATSTPLASEHRSNHRRKTRGRHDRSRVPVTVPAMPAN
jgi:hypothetical protein